MLAGFVTWAGYIIYRIGSFNINDSNMDVYYIAATYGFFASIIAYALGSIFRIQIRSAANMLLKRVIVKRG